MIDKIKNKLRPYYHRPITFLIDQKMSISLIRNYVSDYYYFRKYSLTFNKNGIKNKEANIILQYHGLEKGMLYDDMKSGFAPYRVKSLHFMLNDTEIISLINIRSQIRVGYQVMCKYYGYTIQS